LPSSVLVGPNIFLMIFLSNIISLFIRFTMQILFLKCSDFKQLFIT
jgi:hypothetical protein